MATRLDVVALDLEGLAQALGRQRRDARPLASRRARLAAASLEALGGTEQEGARQELALERKLLVSR